MSNIFKLSIKCDNAAFSDGEQSTCETAGPELSRLLHEIADKIESGCSFDTFKNICDANGNIVGIYALKKADYWKD